jgi:hypothetical protein
MRSAISSVVIAIPYATVNQCGPLLIGIIGASCVFSALAIMGASAKPRKIAFGSMLG